jgi:hypothetical protein
MQAELVGGSERGAGEPPRNPHAAGPPLARDRPHVQHCPAGSPATAATKAAPTLPVAPVIAIRILPMLPRPDRR